MIKHNRLRESQGDGITLSPDSADTQIDSLLTSYEQDALEVDEDAIVPEGRSIKTLLMLLEQEEEAEDDVTSDSDPDDVDPAEALTPKMNIDQFTQSVARLIETYTSRLDIETVIFNRARNYLKEEHGDAVASEFEEIIVTEHGIDLREKPMGDEDDVPGPTYAAGAGPSL